jgi:pimeloyl-ACP methyl ester carboxylesterase
MSSKWLPALTVIVLATAMSGSGRAQPAARHAPAVGRQTAPHPAPGTLFLYSERVPLKAGGFAAAERGTMFVPVNRSNPESGVLGLEVYRFKASPEAASGTPPIFRLYGGPNFLGLAENLARPGFYEADIQPYTQVADLVVVSQRGIGPSKPTTLCDRGPESPLDAPVSRDAVEAATRQMAEACKAYWDGQGLDLRGFTIVEAAADVNDVRRALGYDKITLWGGSFGSHWGMAIMRYHPGIVARAILRGMEGPDHTYDMPSEVLGSLSRMAAAADQAPELRGLIPEGGLLQAFTTVIARAEKEPVRVKVTSPITGQEQVVLFDAWRVRHLAMGYTGRVASRQGMRTWPADVLALYRGDFSQAALSLLGPDEGYRTASYFMLDCGSGISPSRDAKLKADPAVAVLGAMNLQYQAGCPVWHSDLGSEFRKNFETAIPTVIVYGTWDVSTPQENALELAPFFKTHALVKVNGGSHGSLEDAMRASASFRSAVMNFARTGDMSDVPAQVDLPAVEWAVPKDGTSAR